MLFSRANAGGGGGGGTKKDDTLKGTMIKKALWDSYTEQQFKLSKLALALMLSLLGLCLCFAVQSLNIENIDKNTAWNACK